MQGLREEAAAAAREVARLEQVVGQRDAHLENLKTAYEERQERLRWEGGP